MGKLWSIIEDWRDAMEFPPSYRQIALRLKVSQSTFDTWKNPGRMPEARNLYAIHELTSRPFVDVVQAAIDDTELFSEEKAREQHESRVLEKLAPVADQLARMQEKVTELESRRTKSELSEPDESMKPAADDVHTGADEEPGGSEPNE